MTHFQPDDGGQVLAATTSWTGLTISINGSHSTGDIGKYTMKTYWIIKPAHIAYVQFRYKSIPGSVCSVGCRDYGLELKYLPNQEDTSPRVCCAVFNGSVFSSHLPLTPIIVYAVGSFEINSHTFVLEYIASSYNVMMPPASIPYSLQPDTDGIIDDARALTLALQHPYIEIIAITTVHGGPTVEQATINMKRVARANGVNLFYQSPDFIKLLQRGDIPVYKGAADSLAGRPPIVIDEALFGVDGLGGVPDTEPKANQSDANGDHPEDAADVILRLTREIPNLTIICIGPLTNLAKARQKDPEFAHRPAKLIIMGGNYLGMGNSLPFLTAEWNFHCDPEAASIVLQQMQVPIRILPWEASFLRNQYPFINYTTHLLRNTSLASFLYNVTGTIRNYYASIGQQYPYCDEAIIGIAFDEIVARNVPLRANVELNGNFTRGQLAIDYANTVWNDSLQSYVAYDPQESPKPHEFATLIDVKLLDDWMNLATGG